MITYKKKTIVRVLPVLLLLAFFIVACGSARNYTANSTDTNITDAVIPQTASAASSGEVQVVITGGHDTDPRDNGRPVILIASMLGVPSEVFGEAFSHVTPAGAGQEPNPIQVNLNKSALLDVLGPYGVTNEYLDTVSNYYRYNRSAGETWPQTPATAEVVLTNGGITGFVITNPGSGYTSAPTITILNSDVIATASISFTADFSTNGSISAITLNP